MKYLLIVYDNMQHVMYFPMGTAFLAGTLELEGHEVTIFNQAVDHCDERELLLWLNAKRYDVVGVGFVGNYFTHKKIQKISEVVNKSRWRERFYYVLGGHGPSADPEYWIRLTGANGVVIGEGERSILRCHPDSTETIIKSAQIEDLDSIPRPAYHLFPMDVYRLRREPNCSQTDFVMPIISARGCPYKCNFCYRMDQGFRMRSIPHVIDEIDYLKRRYRINYIDFADECTMPSVKRTAELCEALIPLGIKWMCNGRLNVAKDRELLKLMKRAGCVFINYGIESMDDEVLKGIGKKLTVEVITEGVESTLAAGISPGLNIIFGHIGDTVQNLQRGVDFILKYDDFAQRRTMLPVTPYPGSELFNEAVRRGLLKGTGDFFEKHINADLPTVNFTNLTDQEFREALYNANAELLKNHYKSQLCRAVDAAKDIYLNQDTSFRGFRH